MASSQLANCPPKPPWATDSVYTRLMNKPTPFSLEFDICTEGCSNVWEAMALVLEDSVQPSDAISSAMYIGETPNGWPILSIVFASFDCAKAFTYAYLGYTLDNSDEWEVDTDDEVGEYVSYGKFVDATV